jgi:hypothetical protein
LTLPSTLKHSDQPLLKSNTQVVLFEDPALCRVFLDQNLPICYNLDIQRKKENKMEASITVADMMAALSALPPDAQLVVTESGYYSYGELARVGLPEAYTMEGDEDDIPRGTVVYRIGHSHQSY